MGPGCVSRGQSPVLRNGGDMRYSTNMDPFFSTLLILRRKKKEFARILRGTRPIKQQASTTTYRVCVSYVCNISPINRDPAMREKIPESTFWGFYI
jgi:hypothetical protein